MRSVDDILLDLERARVGNDTARIGELLAECQSSGAEQGEIVGRVIRAEILKAEGDVDGAVALLRSALGEAEAAEDLRLQARVLGLLSSALQDKGDLGGGLEAAHEMLRLNETLADPLVGGRAHNCIALAHRAVGDYPSALEHQQQALELFGRHAWRDGIASVTCNVAGSYFHLGRFDDAIEWFERGIALQEELGKTAYVIGTALGLSKAYKRVGEEERGVRLLQQSYERAVELGLGSALANAAVDLARHHVDQGRCELGLEILRAHQGVIDRFPPWAIDRDGVAGVAYANLGRTEESQEHLERGLERATTTGAKDHAADLHRILREVARRTGDFDAYVRHNEEHQRLNEELRGAAAARKVAVQEAERKVTELRREREKERAVLYATLPPHVADRLVRGQDVNDQFEHAAVLFLDLVGFTTLSDGRSAGDVVRVLGDVFRRFDEICGAHDVVKVKTIGDAYLAVALPHEGASSAPESSCEARAAAAALEMMAHVGSVDGVSARIGLHAGPVVAGVIGTDRLQYDVWGDTVNTASRMESSAEPGTIHVTSAFREGLAGAPRSVCRVVERGTLEIKGKGTMTTYCLQAR